MFGDYSFLDKIPFLSEGWDQKISPFGTVLAIEWKNHNDVVCSRGTENN